MRGARRADPPGGGGSGFAPPSSLIHDINAIIDQRGIEFSPLDCHRAIAHSAVQGPILMTPLSCSVVKLARSVMYPCPSWATVSLSATPLSPLSDDLWRMPHLPFIPTKILIRHG